jgi:hypothetical protein
VKVNVLLQVVPNQLTPFVFNMTFRLGSVRVLALLAGVVSAANLTVSGSSPKWHITGPSSVGTADPDYICPVGESGLPYDGTVLKLEPGSVAELMFYGKLNCTTASGC